ncbi:MAG TPA: SH3 domain-containing protein [Roseiflexaceae bacterium]|nr:SH3 domain-containing protein [Roseiflexaceae bacterium]
MASKIRSDDWDRLFEPDAPRRGGPLRALAIMLLLIIVVVLLGAMGLVYSQNQQAQSILRITATARATAIAPFLTATAEAQWIEEERQILAADATATARAQPAPTPANTLPADAIGRGEVLNGGNLRSTPQIANETVIGLIWPGDQIAFLEQLDLGGQIWYRIVVLEPASNRGGEGVQAGTEGWASATLLSEPQPIP